MLRQDNAFIQNNLFCSGTITTQNDYVLGNLFVSGNLTAPNFSVPTSSFPLSASFIHLGVSGTFDVLGTGSLFLSQSGNILQFPIILNIGDMTAVTASSNGNIDLYTHFDDTTNGYIGSVISWVTSQSTLQSCTIGWTLLCPPVPHSTLSNVDLQYYYRNESHLTGTKIEWSISSSVHNITAETTHDISGNTWQKKTITISDSALVKKNDWVTIRADLFGSGSCTGSITKLMAIFY